MVGAQLGMVSGVKRMTCVKYNGDAPAPSKVRTFLRRIGCPITATPYKTPAEIVVMGDGVPTMHYFPERDGMTKAEVVRLLSSTAEEV